MRFLQILLGACSLSLYTFSLYGGFQTSFKQEPHGPYQQLLGNIINRDLDAINTQAKVMSIADRITLAQRLRKLKAGELTAKTTTVEANLSACCNPTYPLRQALKEPQQLLEGTSTDQRLLDSNYVHTIPRTFETYRRIRTQTLQALEHAIALLEQSQ